MCNQIIDNLCQFKFSIIIVKNDEINLKNNKSVIKQRLNDVEYIVDGKSNDRTTKVLINTNTLINLYLAR